MTHCDVQYDDDDDQSINQSKQICIAACVASESEAHDDELSRTLSVADDCVYHIILRHAAFDCSSYLADSPLTVAARVA